MIVTALLVTGVLAGAGLAQAAVLARLLEGASWRRATVSYALGLAALAMIGVAAAIVMAQLPPTLAGLVGVLPLVRGVRRLGSLRFVAEKDEARAAIGDVAIGYLSLVATRAASEIAVAAIVLAVLGAAAVFAPRVSWKPRVIAAGTLVALGVYLLVDGHALALFI